LRRQCQGNHFLEAAGYVTALRSFRGANTRLVGLGLRKPAGVVSSRTVRGEPLTSRSPAGPRGDVGAGPGDAARDFIGKFPTVVFSSQDNQFMRGAPACATLARPYAGGDGSSYLTALQSTRGGGRANMLLKQGGRDAARWRRSSMSWRAAVILVAKRTAGIGELSEFFRASHFKLVRRASRPG